MSEDVQNRDNKNLRTETFSSSYETDFYIPELILLGIVGGTATYSICSVVGQCSTILGISSN